MSVGDLKDYGNKGNNFPWQLAVLQLLDAIATGGGSAGLALESTLQQVLAAIQSGVDFEAKLVVDNNNVTWLEVRTWNQGSGSFNPPVYYMAGSNTPGSPALPITYINPQTLLAQIASNTTGLNLEVTQLLVKAVLDAIKLDTANLDVALSTRASEATLNNLYVAFNAEDFATETTLQSLLTAFNAEDFATATNQASLFAAITARFGLLGQKPSAGSAPVVLSTEQEALLNAIKTAVENIDLDTNGLAQETTLQSLLTAFNAEDFASETTLAALLAAFNAEDFATETTLATRASEATALLILAALSGLATEATLSAVNTKLTGASRTATYVVAVANGATPAGVQSISLSFRGTNGTLNGAVVPNGYTISFSPNKGEDTIGAINYTVPTTGAMQILIAYTI